MPLRMSTVNYTSLLTKSQRNALLPDRLQRVSIAFIIIGFGLLTFSAIVLVTGPKNSGNSLITYDEVSKTVGLDNEESPITTITTITTDEDDMEKFLFLDWRLELGWNNVRYELEHHTFYAHLLNRTLVIPEEIHLRKCLQEALCTFIGRRIHDGDWDSEGGKDRWTIPIKHFIDLPHLKSKLNVLTVKEFVALQLRRAEAQSNKGLAKTLKKLLSSANQLDLYAKDGNKFVSTLTHLSSAKTNMFGFLHEQQKGIVVVDDLEPIKRTFKKKSKAQDTTIYAFIDRPGMTIDVGYTIKLKAMPPRYWDDPNASKLFPFTETPRKHVRQDLREWDEDSYDTPDSYVAFKGFIQTWTVPPYSNATLFHLEGDPHRFGFQPMKFSTVAGRELYRQIVFDWIRYAPSVTAAADFAWSRLMRLTNNSQILTFHLRRGDFSRLGWNGVLSKEDETAGLVARAVTDLRKRFKDEARKDNQTLGNLSTRFFLSTDDESRDGVLPLYDKGAVRLMDLLSVNLTNEAGEANEIQSFWDTNLHVTAFGDWMGLVEQDLCSRGWFFVGTTMSSFSGGILNLRSRAGRTSDESCFTDPWV